MVSVKYSSVSKGNCYHIPLSASRLIALRLTAVQNCKQFSRVLFIICSIVFAYVKCKSHKRCEK